MTSPLASAAELSPARHRLLEQLLMRGGNASDVAGIKQIPRGTRVSPSPAQARIWFFCCLFPTSAEYNLFETLHLDVVPDAELLMSALRRLMARHDALCLRIVERNGAANQEVCSDLDPPVEWFDVSELSPVEAERRAKQIG